MSLRSLLLSLTAVVALFSQSLTQAADAFGLEAGAVPLKSIGPLAFGPDGILFVGDTKAATLFAIQTGDKSDTPAADRQIEGVGQLLATALAAPADKILVQDLAANPLTGSIFLSCLADGQPALAKIDGAGQVSRVDLSNIKFSKVELPNPPADAEVGEGRRRRNNRSDSITDLAWVDGQVLISGLSSADAPSQVRSLLFPFNNELKSSSLEIYHAAHGQMEDYAPIRTFVPFVIDGQPHVLAGFVCTPLVKFPVADIGGEEKFRGTTVAELGNRNRPLDMIAYKKGGEDFLLMANNARGVMKISTSDLDRDVGLTDPVKGGGAAGQTYETIGTLMGVVQLDRLNDESAVVLIQNDKQLDLKTIALP